MRVTRKKSIALVLIIFGIFFGSAVTLIRKRQAESAKQTEAVKDQTVQEKLTKRLSELQPAGATTPGTTDSASVVLGRFSRSETKNGQKLWDVQATEGRYSPMSGTISLVEPVLTLFQKDGGFATLKANKADLSITGNSLNSAKLSGAVRLTRSDGLSLETSEATYSAADQMVRAPGTVTVKGPRVDITGKGLIANVQEKSLYLAENVSTVVHPAKGAPVVPRVATDEKGRQTKRIGIEHAN